MKTKEYTCNYHHTILWVSPHFCNYRVPAYSYQNQYTYGRL